MLIGAVFVGSDGFCPEIGNSIFGDKTCGFCPQGGITHSGKLGVAMIHRRSKVAPVLSLSKRYRGHEQDESKALRVTLAAGQRSSAGFEHRQVGGHFHQLFPTFYAGSGTAHFRPE